MAQRKFSATDTTWKITEGRECGPCTACCIYLGIEELQKPTDCVCKFLTGSGHKRCGIYPDRPKACVEYECAWRSGWGPDWARPVTSGFLVTMYHSPDIQGGFDATINVFDNSKTSPTRLMRLCTQILLLGASELRMIDLKTKKAILYRKGYVYNCRLLPAADGYETMMFEAEDIPVGKYHLE